MEQTNLVKTKQEEKMKELKISELSKYKFNVTAKRLSFETEAEISEIKIFDKLRTYKDIKEGEYSAGIMEIKFVVGMEEYKENYNIRFYEYSGNPRIYIADSGPAGKLKNMAVSQFKIKKDASFEEFLNTIKDKKCAIKYEKKEFKVPGKPEPVSYNKIVVQQFLE